MAKAWYSFTLLDRKRGQCNKKPPFLRGGFLIRRGKLGSNALFSKNAFLFERTNRLGAQGHGNLLSINHEGFLLEVRLEHTVRATQREANIVAKLLSFTGEFASCCHSIFSLSCFILRTLGTILPFLPFEVKSYGVNLAGVIQ